MQRYWKIYLTNHWCACVSCYKSLGKNFNTDYPVSLCLKSRFDCSASVLVYHKVGTSNVTGVQIPRQMLTTKPLCVDGHVNYMYSYMYQTCRFSMSQVHHNVKHTCRKVKSQPMPQMYKTWKNETEKITKISAKKITQNRKCKGHKNTKRYQIEEKIIFLVLNQTSFLFKQLLHSQQLSSSVVLPH